MVIPVGRQYETAEIYKSIPGISMVAANAFFELADEGTWEDMQAKYAIET